MNVVKKRDRAIAEFVSKLVFSLGLAYAGSNREDVISLLLPVMGDSKSSMEVRSAGTHVCVNEYVLNSSECKSAKKREKLVCGQSGSVSSSSLRKQFWVCVSVSKFQRRWRHQRVLLLLGGRTDVYRWRCCVAGCGDGGAVVRPHRGRDDEQRRDVHRAADTDREDGGGAQGHVRAFPRAGARTHVSR